MKTQRYQLCVSGLREDGGQIKMATLRRVLDALLTTAERTTRLLATGAGSGKGARPHWLDSTIDFTVTGLKSGSTIFDVEAPQLSETACEQFTQADSWSMQPSLNDTALDLAAQRSTRPRPTIQLETISIVRFSRQFSSSGKRLELPVCAMK